MVCFFYLTNNCVFMLSDLKQISFKSKEVVLYCCWLTCWFDVICCTRSWEHNPDFQIRNSQLFLMLLGQSCTQIIGNCRSTASNTKEKKTKTSPVCNWKHIHSTVIFLLPNSTLNSPQITARKWETLNSDPLRWNEMRLLPIEKVNV